MGIIKIGVEIMKMKICAGLLAVAFAAPASAASLLTNGGFETGDFTGWTQVSGGGIADCNSDWYVSSTDTQCNYPNTTLNGAPEGNFAAYNAFDGSANASYTIEQDFTLSTAEIASATLSWQQSVGWDFGLGAVATLDRVFSLSFFDVSNTLIGNVYTLAIGQSDGITGFIDWIAVSRDVKGLLSGFEGQTVTLVADVFIPQTATGPGTLGVDAFSLEVTAVPLPASALLLASGLFGLRSFRRRTS
jgi:hypothetical protein